MNLNFWKREKQESPKQRGYFELVNSPDSNETIWPFEMDASGASPNLAMKIATVYRCVDKVTNETETGGQFELDKTKPYYTGKMMITSLDVKSTDGDIATCSASFAGIGALVEGIPTT